MKKNRFEHTKTAVNLFELKVVNLKTLSWLGLFKYTTK